MLKNNLNMMLKQVYVCLKGTFKHTYILFAKIFYSLFYIPYQCIF